MDFIDQLKTLSSTAAKQLDNIKTEEATKMALIAPFINALGYNVFDPSEVVPEFTADVPGRNNDKVDYAIMLDGKAIILIECKSYGTNLDDAHKKQLHKYFHVTESRIGVLTDGVIYRFYSDLEKPNIMDDRPFLELNILDLEHAPVEELKKLTKAAFNIEEMLPAAWELKYTREFRKILVNQSKEPSDDFVRVLAKATYSGVIGPKKLEQFKEITKQALKEFVNLQVNARLQTAMAVSEDLQVDFADDSEEAPDSGNNDDGIETTEEELQGYHIVQAILASETTPERITWKDTRSYFNVLLDNNSWRPICRLYLNSKSIKRIGLFDKEEEYKEEISSVSDLYKYADQLKGVLVKYEKKISVSA